MRNKGLLTIVLFSWLFFLSGCWDINEPERMVYATGYGLDYQNNRFTIYLQLMEIGKQKSDGGGLPEAKKKIVRGSGKDVDEAIFNIYKVSGQRIYWGHLSYVLLTETALKNKGLQQTIDTWDRFYETRYSIWFYVTQEPIKEIFQATNLLKLSDPNISFEQSSFLRPIDMRRIILTLDEPGHQANLPVVSLKHNSSKGSEGQSKSVLFDGIAIITSDNSKGLLTGKNLIGYRWMTKETSRDQILIKKNGKSAVSIVIEQVKPSIIPRIDKKNDVSFDIQIQVTANISILYQNVDISFLNSEISKLISKEVKQTYLAALKKNVDLYRLSEKVYRKNLLVWKEKNQDGIIPLDEHSIRSIQVQVKLRSSNQLRMNHMHSKYIHK